MSMFTRWKGENVSTNEVDSVVGSILDLKDATSYGVEIPDTDAAKIKTVDDAIAYVKVKKAL